jgi:uncharacterized cupredoxin-like copper-binding protein
MRSNPKPTLALLSVLLLMAALACRAGVPSDRPVSEGNPGSAPSATEGTTIDIVVEEFGVNLDSTQAKAGDITFVVRNDGNMPHDFAISGPGVEEKTPMLDPGETANLEVTLEAGAYQYICTVPGHAMLGMEGDFTVAP